jgi:hypothetical protein
MDFQKWDDKNMIWSTQWTVAQQKTFTGADLVFDPGWQDFSPAIGEKWRIQVSGFYIRSGFQYWLTPVQGPEILTRTK